MKKEVLAAKCFRGKRAELWCCDKAAAVHVGTTTVHSAGRFVGKFLVVASEHFATIEEALVWRPHTLFCPGSSSFAETLQFYHRLFSLTGVAEGRHTFYAWEDELLDRYIVHEDFGQISWDYELQPCTTTFSSHPHAQPAKPAKRPRGNTTECTHISSCVCVFVITYWAIS
jgi:hypothetical protein